MRRWLVMVLLGGVSTLSAHTIHRSTAEAEYRAESRTLEISLTLYVDDLELALMRQSERLMNITSTPKAVFDAELLKYLRRTFVLTQAENQEVTWQWLGREMEAADSPGDDPTVTLFLIVPLPHGWQACKLRHQVLTDLFPDQTNLLLLRTEKGQTQFAFTAQDAAKALLTP